MICGTTSLTEQERQAGHLKKWPTILAVAPRTAWPHFQSHQVLFRSAGSKSNRSSNTSKGRWHSSYPVEPLLQIVELQVRLQELSLEDTLDALAAVAQAIAQGIGRKWAEEQLEKRVHERTRELALLLEVSQNITSTLEL